MVEKEAGLPPDPGLVVLGDRALFLEVGDILLGTQALLFEQDGVILGLAALAVDGEPDAGPFDRAPVLGVPDDQEDIERIAVVPESVRDGVRLPVDEGHALPVLRQAVDDGRLRRPGAGDGGLRGGGRERGGRAQDERGRSREKAQTHALHAEPPQGRTALVHFLMKLRTFLAMAARSPSGSSVRNFSKLSAALALSALLR